MICRIINHHMMRKLILPLLLLTNLYSFCQREMENLDRGISAVSDGTGKVFVSWRLLATDPANISFDLFRTTAGKTKKLNATPISKTTGFTDSTSDTTQARSYVVKVIWKNKALINSRPFVLKPGNLPYTSIHLQTPAGYAPNDASVGDLDGDG